MPFSGPEADVDTAGFAAHRRQAAFLLSAVLAIVLGIAPAASANSAGGPPFTSGGDFPGERNCTLCHQGAAANSGSGRLEVLVGESPASEFRYRPGEQATLLVRFSDKDAVRVGFQLSVRSGDGCGQPGALSAHSSAPGGSVRIRDGACGAAASQVQWATHRRPVTGNSADFKVNWAALDESGGPVTVAVAVNSANGDLSPRGDRIYTSQVTIQPYSMPSAPPTISEGGVILADLFSQTATGAPNAIAAVRGTGFAATGTAAHARLDALGRVSTVLDGVCVQVSQRAAPVFHVLPDQVNFQIPSNAGIGATTVEVVRGCGTDEEARSNRAPLNIAKIQPVFFLFSQSPPAVALHLDGSVVAPPNTLPGRTSRPAAPGEVLTAFGTGFGPVFPPLESGESAVEPRALAAASVRAFIGQVELDPSDIVYAGAAPNLAGLYQLSLRIPDMVSAGTHDFSVMVDGVRSAAGPRLVIAVPEPGPPRCSKDLRIPPGGGCALTIRGISFTFSVDQAGTACVSVPSLAVNICGTDTLDLSLYGSAVRKNEDGSWTIVKLPS